ncbi:ParB/Srx family N-terminal domain-containing protein [Staphylococcus warneri]|uniref:ParB/Srx family N-terminal domain-containing protein n=1 Tax=Staphylococcus warneri TaxID=1292 RepID=UPI001A8F225A|nr:ParB/Srx family N-terminal domain-containing protein [Staphylococcus warneri]MBO0378087.1 ParB N-terminal domain-containing protein [Staphylococcus warneri]
MYNRKLYITDLNTDMSYQSPVKEAQVKKIVKHFDPQKLHTIVVNKRENGQFYIIDGQHRVQALKELGICVRCSDQSNHTCRHVYIRNMGR